MRMDDFYLKVYKPELLTSLMLLNLWKGPHSVLGIPDPKTIRETDFSSRTQLSEDPLKENA